jgi:hypothetical protein
MHTPTRLVVSRASPTILNVASPVRNANKPTSLPTFNITRSSPADIQHRIAPNPKMSSRPPSIPLSILPRPPPPSPRNIANAYGLTIPPPSQRRSTYQRRDTPTQYLDPPEPASEKKGTPYLSIPKATIVVKERVKPYILDGDGGFPSSTESRSDRSDSPEEKPEKRRRKVDDRILAFAVTSILVLFLAIGIPLGVILPQKYIKPLPIKVLVPFYLKPELGSWSRLEDAWVPHCLFVNSPLHKTRH